MVAELERVQCSSDTPQSRDPQRGFDLPSHLGEFRILSQIGKGGMGVVYEAIQEPLGRRVALKVLYGSSVRDPLLVERFKREAQAASQLHHTNIVPVFGIGEAAGTHYYAMQFISGLSLDRLLEKQRTNTDGRKSVATRATQDLLDQQASLHINLNSGQQIAWEPIGLSGQGREYYERVARIGGQAADALQTAHDNGVLHRDIKPANLILDTQGNIWVSDFGLARIHGLAELTVSENVPGTLRYIPPEGFKGNERRQRGCLQSGFNALRIARR